MTVLWITSSGREVTSADLMNHCRPASWTSAYSYKGRERPTRTFATQHLRHAILLVEEAFLVYLIQQAPFAIPRGDGLEILLALFLRPQVTQLNNDQRILSCRPGS